VDSTQRIVAVGLWTGRDMSVLGQGFRRLYRPAQDEAFSELLARIDAAAERHCRATGA
jgi:hypothetical protein